MIRAVGIDMVSIAKFKAAMDKRGERFLKRLFTERELSYCLSMARPEAHLSGRFAAKVSVFKAVGVRLRFKDVEIGRETASGRPVVFAPLLDGGCTVAISISHTETLAVAEAIAEERGGSL